LTACEELALGQRQRQQSVPRAILLDGQEERRLEVALLLGPWRRPRNRPGRRWSNAWTAPSTNKAVPLPPSVASAGAPLRYRPAPGVVRAVRCFPAAREAFGITGVFSKAFSASVTVTPLRRRRSPARKTPMTRCTARGECGGRCVAP
jgi:hypothetical protein